MNTDFINGFLETARRKSIAKASESLHISHTALSKQIQSLEKHFDIQLFIRSSVGVELTPAGQVFYESACTLLEKVSELSSALEPHRMWNRLLIGTTPDIASRFLTTVLATLHENGIEAELVLRQSTKDAYELLTNREIDVLFAERISNHPSLWIKDVYQEPLFVVVPKDHPFAIQSSITIEQLSQEPLILYPKGCTIRAKLLEMFEASQLQMNIKTEVGFHEVVISYVAGGGGITVLPEALVWNLSSDRIDTVPLLHSNAHRTISIASLQQDKAEKIMRLLSLPNVL